MTEFRKYPLDDAYVLKREQRCDHHCKRYVHRWYLWKDHTVFVKFRDKGLNRTREEVATHQHLCDQIKLHFELQPVETRIVVDPVEGVGVQQRWWPCAGTINMKGTSRYWMNPRGLFEILKICLFDGTVGSLDRHGNNVIVMEDGRLITIDDEDQFYHNRKRWIKFDKNIRAAAYMILRKYKPQMDAYVKRVHSSAPKILKLADCKVMKADFPDARRGDRAKAQNDTFYNILAANVKALPDVYEEMQNQLLV